MVSNSAYKITFGENTVLKICILMSGIFGGLLIFHSQKVQKTLRDYGTFAFDQKELETLSRLPKFCILVGILCIFAVSVSMWGIINESFRCCLVNSIFLGLILYFGLHISYMPFPSRDWMRYESMDRLQESFDLYMDPSPNGESATTFWNRFQRKFRCCGNLGITDWHIYLSLKPPIVCCIEMNSECVDERNSNQMSLAYMYTDGCVKKFTEFLHDQFMDIKWIFAPYQIALSICFASSVWLTKVYLHKTRISSRYINTITNAENNF